MNRKVSTALVTGFWLLVLASFILLRWNNNHQVLNSPPGKILIIDSRYYYHWAQNIVHGEGLGHTVFFMSPLYPIFLAFSLWLFGESVHSGILLQLVLSLGTLGLIGWFTSRRFGNVAGLIAGLLYTFYAPSIYYDSVLQSSTLILFLTMVALTFLDEAEQSGNRRWVILAGLTIGLSALARPNALILLPFFAFVFIHKWKKYGVELLVILLFTTLLIIFPAILRNYLKGGEWLLTTNSAGVNFFIGNHQQANGLYTEPPWLTSAEPAMEALDYQEEAQRRLGRPLTINQASWFWMKQGVDWILHHPVDWTKLELRKIVYFFNRVESPNNVSFYGVREYSKILQGIGFINFGWIAPLGLIGLFLARREDGWWFPAMLVLAYLIASLLFFVSGEYRYPIMGILIGYGAGMITRTVNKLRQKEIETAQFAMISLLILLMICNIPWKVMKSLSSPKMDYFNWASVSFEQGDLTNAVLLFTATIAWDPTWREPHLQLAQVYDDLHLITLANEEYDYAGISREELKAARLRSEIATVVDPDSLNLEGAFSPEQLYQIGARFNQLYKFEQAAVILERCVNLDSTNLEARFQYGYALEGIGEFKKALQIYFALERVNDKDPLIPYRIAHVFMATGDRGMARSTLNRVLEKVDQLTNQESRERWRQLVKRTDDSFMNF